MFGLPEQVLKLLQRYFAAHPQIVKVVVYGSRAMGRETAGSDVDLAIITKGDRDISGRIQADLEELPTPYLFDVIDYERVVNPSLREHIDRVGIVLYCISVPPQSP
ncbi:MAG: nucleotidyltransferase domain-containing protein [Chlamydiia bacterium]|nr:nucleotidyltransferase domain-containing protein [Chlamydiia bacterium]